MHVWVVWNAPHESGLLHNCHRGGLWGCIKLALLKNCLGISLAKKRTICKFSFLLCLQKSGSDHPDSEANMSKFMFALEQSKGAHWQPTPLQSGGPSPRGGQTKLGSTSDGQQGETEPWWYEAVLLCTLTELQILQLGQSPHRCFPA